MKSQDKAGMADAYYYLGFVYAPRNREKAVNVWKKSLALREELQISNNDEVKHLIRSYSLPR